MFNQLQTRLIVAFVLVLLIPTAIITAYSTVSSASSLIDSARNASLQDSRRVAATLQEGLSRTRSDVIFLSRAAGGRNYADAIVANDTQNIKTALAQLQTVFLAYAQNAQIYAQISFLDATGQEIVRVNLTNDRALIVAKNNLQSEAEKSYFKATTTLASGKVFISELDLAKDAQTVDKPLLMFSTPVYTSLGGFGGTIVAARLMQPLFALIKSDNPAQAVYLINNTNGDYLVGADDSQLYAHNRGRGGNFLEDHPNDGAQIIGQTEGTLLNTFNQRDSLQTFSRVGLPDQESIQWTLYYTQAASTIFGDISNSRLVIIALGVISLLIAVTVALIITRGIVHPVQALTIQALAISNGDLSQQVNISPRGEIGTLARAFNNMTRQLASSYATLEKRVEERTAQLAQAQHTAEQASKAKSIFLSNMSHELRTPLNVVIGYTSSMLEMPQMYDNVVLPPIYRSDIQLIMDNGRYLLGLINDILDLSKIEAGKLELQRSAVKLTDVFQGVISTSIGLIKDKPIQIRPDFPDTLPCVYADAMRVRQIILNLMSNAVKFTEAGSVTLSARVKGQFLIISVSDTGIGIPEKSLSRIFDRYQQAEQDTERHYGGTGLGLDISKQLSQMHGGELIVQSIIGQGSTFSFTLPLATSEQLVETHRLESPERVATIFDPTAVNMTNPSTILLIEDEASLRTMMRRALEGVGYMVIDTEDGAQANEMAVGLLPDLILLDVQLPNLDGWKVLKGLKEHPETAALPVMVCTGRDVTGLTARGEVPEATAYLAKPFTPEQLITSVQKVLAQPKITENLPGKH